MAIFRRVPPLITGASNARGWQNHDFRPTFRFISEKMQDRAILWKANRKPHLTFRMVGPTSLNDLQWLITHNSRLKTIIQRQITRKWYNVELYIRWPTNRKSYMIYRMAPFWMDLNDPYPRFQGHSILWRWISQKRYEIQTYFQWNTNRDLYTPYSTLPFRVTLSDLVT